MKTIALLLIVLVAGCSSVPPERPPTTKAQRIRQLQTLLGGWDYTSVKPSLRQAEWTLKGE